MTYFFRLTGETPSKKNSRVTNTKTGRTFPNKRFTQWHNLALKEIKQEKITNEIKEPLAEPLRATLLFTHGDKRRRDSDNGTSSIMDLLTDAEIIQDDNYNIIQEIRIYNYYEKNNASCYIILEPMQLQDDKKLKDAIDFFLN